MNIHETSPHTAFDRLKALLESREATIGVIGLGYVGLPLSMAALASGFSAIGYDIDKRRVEETNKGRSPIGRITDESLGGFVRSGKFVATDDPEQLRQCDVIVICVPTPLDRYREPDLSFVVKTAETIATVLRPGQLISLESTTYPGTTRDIVRPILEAGGLTSGEDFFLCFSPEREDPGNPDFHTASIPKVVGGNDPASSQLGVLFYSSIVERVVPVGSCEVAEAVKLTENIFRSVNIALVNELKLIYAKMGINVWDVIDAAKTKPFGFMPFYPGPGLGGHCIPIDPFYLSWKAREFDVRTRFIELAGEINTDAPYRVVETLVSVLGRQAGKALARSRILVLGVAYKKNVEDTRESPAFKLIELLEREGAETAFHDPYVPEIPRMREHPEVAGRKSISVNPETLASFDAVLVCTDHDQVDYDLVGRHAALVIDTRNALRNVKERDNIFLA